MKKILQTATLLLFITFPQISVAFWNSDHTTEKETITLEVNTEQVFIKHIRNLKPNQDTDWSGLFVFPPETTNIKIYLNSDNLNYKTFTEEKKREYLFDLAKKSTNPHFFNLESESFPIFIATDSVKITKDSTLKITYETSLTNQQDWKLFSLPLHLSPQSQEQEFYIRYPKEFYFLNNLKKPLSHQYNTNERERNIQLNFKKPFYTHPLSFAWSKNQNPLTQDYKGMNYQAFPQNTKTLEPQNITILIDQSGSIDTGKWQKTSEVLRYLLNEVWIDKNIRVGFFNDELSWVTKNDEKEPTFKANDFEWRQSFINSLSTARPLGKTDIKTVILEAQKNVPENHAWIFITDEPQPEEVSITPLGVFGFNEDLDALNTWKTDKSWTQNLFSTQVTLLEQTQIQEKLNAWTATIKDLKNSENLIDGHLISQTKQIKSPFIIGRTHQKNQKNPVLQWLPQIWATSQNTKLKQAKQTTEVKDAQNSIKTVFGLDQENQPNIKTIDQIPYYEEQTYDYSERVDPNTELVLQPFSDLQKELFLKYPTKTAQGFGAGEVNFCTDIRCLKIQEGGLKESNTFSKAYWNEKDPNHWAREFVEPMVKEGIYPLNPNGNLELDKPIKRGDFAIMLYQQIPSQRWRKGTPIVFSDLPEEHPSHEAISWFSEHKIIQGYGDETVKPDSQISRAEAVKILLAADLFKPSKEEQESYFKDTKDWVIPWTNEAQKRSIIQGYDNKLFKPHQSLSKGQAAKLVTKFSE